MKKIKKAVTTGFKDVENMPPAYPVEEAHRFSQDLQADQAKNEIGRYLKGDTEISGDALVWWKNNGSKYPNLARDYSGAMATSVPSEDLFSGGVDVIDPDRIRLEAETITKVMSLKSWLKKGILVIKRPC